jgi:predicted choloylglycine hydrolase
MKFADSVTEEQLKRFMAQIFSVAGDPTSLSALCNRLRIVGPPDYHPTYMIQHGITAFTGGGGNALVANFDSAAAWQESLNTYLHCPSP